MTVREYPSGSNVRCRCKVEAEIIEETRICGNGRMEVTKRADKAL